MNQPQLFATEQTTRTSDNYYTPKWIFDALGLTFDLDVACPPEGPAHTPCHAYYTQKDNGLTSPWHGLVWMNPPYSQPAPWVEKWVAHSNGVALLPFTKGKWNVNLWASEAVGVMPIYTVKFHVPGQSRLLEPGPFANVIWAIGEEAVTALLNSSLGRSR